MIWIGIPTGQRTKQAVEVVKAWSQYPEIRIVIYTWDKETFNECKPYAHLQFRGNRKTFPQLQNFLISQVDFDLYICGADDLFPGNAIEKLSRLPLTNTYLIDDGIQKFQATHPVISKSWYQKHKYVFSEEFQHNYCDTDFFVRVCNKGELVEVSGISFDHRHCSRTGRLDDIYRLGQNSFEQDRKTFIQKYGYACPPRPELPIINV